MGGWAGLGLRYTLRYEEVRAARPLAHRPPPALRWGRSSHARSAHATKSERGAARSSGAAAASASWHMRDWLPWHWNQLSEHEERIGCAPRGPAYRAGGGHSEAPSLCSRPGGCHGRRRRSAAVQRSRVAQRGRSAKQSTSPHARPSVKSILMCLVQSSEAFMTCSSCKGMHVQKMKGIVWYAYPGVRAVYMPCTRHVHAQCVVSVRAVYTRRAHIHIHTPAVPSKRDPLELRGCRCSSAA